MRNKCAIARIIQASSNPGDIVLDCFSGSGTTLAAASQLDRYWIGVDNSPEAIATTLRRFATGPEIMGDFIGATKSETEEGQIQQMLPLFGSLEASQQNTSTFGENLIRDFHLYVTETYSRELESSLEQWKEWSNSTH